MIADAVGLVAAVAGRGEVHGAGRHLAGVGVPLEDEARLALEMAEEPVLVCGGLGAQPIPADLGNRVRVHGGAHRGRQQLRAETHAEHGLAALHGFPYDVDFGSQVRVMLGLVDVHRTTEHDQAVVARYVRPRMRVAAEVDVADADARPAQQGIEVAQGLGSHVLQDEDLAHRDGAAPRHSVDRGPPIVGFRGDGAISGRPSGRRVIHA